MKRLAGAVVVVGLIGGAIWIGLNVGGPSVPTYSLVENGKQEIGVITIRPGSELCWDLSIRPLSKAIQLHHGVPGSDPVVLSLFEPPGDLKPEGCALLPPEYTRLLSQDHSAFYVDGHDSDDQPASFRAELVEM